MDAAVGVDRFTVIETDILQHHIGRGQARIGLPSTKTTGVDA